MNERYDIMHEHDDQWDLGLPLPGAFLECMTHRYVTIIEGYNHSLKGDYKDLTLSRK